jgi:hypothetical protein
MKEVDIILMEDNPAAVLLVEMALRENDIELPHTWKPFTRCPVAGRHRAAL